MSNHEAAMTIEVRLEGFTLAVEDVSRSVEFYGEKLGLVVEANRAPTFAMIRVGGPLGGTIGLLSTRLPEAAAARSMTREQRAAIQVELSTDELDVLYEQLTARGVNFHRPPQDHPWERSMQTYDPDGYTVEFAQGRRGHNRPA
jgi:catechol 2,3-dioxygenase-like lactoylglutathione lyase family enzyme